MRRLRFPFVQLIQLTRYSAAFAALVAFASSACGGAAQSGQTAQQAQQAAQDAKIDSEVSRSYASEGGMSGGILGGMPLSGNSVAMTATPLGPALMARQLAAGEAIKLDGRIAEWPALSHAAIAVRGAGPAAMDVALQYDDEHVYIACEIRDATFERTRDLSLREDYASLTIAFPTARGINAYEIGLFPGKSGVTAGAVKRLGGGSIRADVAGAKLVESESAGKIVFEAKIPWSTFAEAAALRLGLRAAVAYHDATAAGGIVSTGKGDAEHPALLPQLFTEPEIAVADGLLAPQGLAQVAPNFDVFANVVGDGAKERISVYGHYLTVCGPKYRGGKQYFFREYPGEIVALEALHVASPARDDLLVRRRIQVAGSKRELLEILSFAGDEPSTVFAHELAVVSADKRVSNTFRMNRGLIEIATEPAQGWDAASYREGPLSDLPNLLLPWGSVKSRRFALEGTRFVMKDEVAQPGTAPASTGAPNTQVPSAATVVPRAPTAPAGPARGPEFGKSMVAAYLQERRLAAGTTPKLDLSAQVSESSTPESVLLFGRELVIFGPAFRGGQRYETLNLSQFASDADLLNVATRDVTGDGAQELLVRGILRADSPGGAIAREVLIIYEVATAGIRKLFAVELERRLGSSSVRCELRYVPTASGGGVDLQLRRGPATGFTAANYPWAEERPGSGATEPLLLPWSTSESVRYAWNGSAFAPVR